MLKTTIKKQILENSLTELQVINLNGPKWMIIMTESFFRTDTMIL